jgi:hypothetical protein
MSSLTFVEQINRDRTTVNLLDMVITTIERGALNSQDPKPYFYEYEEKDFEVFMEGLSDKARQQATEEVRQILALMERLNKRRTY